MPAKHVHEIKLGNLNKASAGRCNEAHVRRFLFAVDTLQAWQSEARPSHKVRDAMTKLGSEWNVPQKTSGKKRAPADVAKDLERELLATARRLLDRTNPFSRKRGIAEPTQDDTSPQSGKGHCKNQEKRPNREGIKSIPPLPVRNTIFY